MTVLDLLSSSAPLFIGTCLAVGLLVGSFLNVVIYRLPVILDRQWREQCAELCGTSAAQTPEDTATFNLIVPRSACRSCRAPITALQNIPVVSYLALRGRCARCGIRI